MNPPEDPSAQEAAAHDGTMSPTPAKSENREFERYVLVSALILLVLCLLWIDRRSALENVERTGTDRVLRVEIGDSTGAPATRTAGASERDSAATAARRRITPPPARRVPPPPEERIDHSATDRVPPRNDDTTALVRPYVPPEAPQLAPVRPAPEPRERLYKVRPNDTLSGIASRELGRAGRAMEIARLNGISDPRKLRAGATIKLPQE